VAQQIRQFVVKV
jgi:hypothetical protein